LPDPNAVRFDPAARRGHVESYFLKANDERAERAIWIKATIFASNREPDRVMAEGWAIAFDRRSPPGRHIAVKHSLPYSRAMFSAQGLGVGWTLPGRAGGAGLQDSTGEGLQLEPGATRGAITTRGHRIAWDLRFTTDSRPLLPFPSEAMYTGPFPKSKLVTPYPDARFDGEVTVDGESWSAAGWRGMQGHNWGRGHADRYAWCHANLWNEEDEFVLEGLSGQVRVGPVLSPLVTIVCVRYRGVTYDFNRLPDMLRARGNVTLRAWSFSSENKFARIEGAIEANTEDMVGLYYPNPDGPMTYCLNSKLARGEVRFEIKGRPPLLLRTRAAALEIGTRDPDHGVEMRV
jgi:hypothetical protein